MAHDDFIETERRIRDYDTLLFDTKTTASAWSTPQSIEEGLIEAGARRALARRLEYDAMMDLTGWMQHARREGVPIAQIARLARVTRQTVYVTTGA